MDPSPLLYKPRRRAPSRKPPVTGYPAGSISVLAEVPPGATVDLLLDVTGYYD